MKKITPFLWFNNDAENAARFYVSVFKKGKIGRISRYSKGAPAPAGSVMQSGAPERSQRRLAGISHVQNADCLAANRIRDVVFKPR